MAYRYNRINWQNKPNVATPISAENLNKMDKGIDDNDKAIGDLAQLNTSNKSSLVSAVNELNNNLDDFSSQLASTKYEVGLKADKTYVDTITQSIASGSPKGVYATVADLNNAFPTGDTNIYLVTADGKWYYWSGSAWTAGGVYQSTGLADKSVEWKHLNTMQPFIYPYPRHSLVIEQDASYNLYVKCTNIYVRNIPGPREYSWSAIMSQLPNNVATSPSGVENCLKIINGDALVFNVVDKKFEIGVWNNISPQQIKLVMANDEDLTGEFINRHFFRTINNRLSTLETAVSNGIPEYWKTELATKIAHIKEKQLEGNTFSVAFITDMHYPTNYMQSPKLLAEVIKRCDIPYFYNGGDEVNQASTRAESLARHRAVMNAFKDVGIIDRMLMCIGNHDDNTQGSAGNIPENIALRPEMVYSEMVRHGETSYMIKSSANKLYSYADNEAQKVRFIALNGHDAVFKVDENNNVVDSGYMTAAYRQEQIDWLINVALDLPDDSWSVVIGSHASGMTNDFWGNAKNKDIVIGILNAFNNKTTFSKSNTHADPDYNVSVDVDFTNSGGEVICWIGGHMHEDRIGVVPGTTIPAIDVESDSYQEPSAVSVPKVKGTTTEQAFDIFTFNKDTRTCYITRIGAGADRQFNY